MSTSAIEAWSNRGHEKETKRKSALSSKKLGREKMNLLVNNWIYSLNGMHDWEIDKSTDYIWGMLN